MYFVEYVIREAISQSIEACKQVISSEGQKEGTSKRGLKDFRREEGNLLDELKDELLALHINEGGEGKAVDEEHYFDDLDGYIEAISRLCLTKNELCVQKASEFRSKAEYEGTSFNGNRFSTQFTSKLINIISKIQADFSESSGNRTSYHAHAFRNKRHYTEESHGKDWLCHFIRGRFAYLVIKLAEKDIKGANDDLFERKLENIDTTYTRWTNEEVQQLTLQKLARAAEIAAQMEEAIGDSASRRTRSSRKSRNRSYEDDQDSLETNQLSSSQQQLQEHISELQEICQGVSQPNPAHLKQKVLEIVQSCKAEDKKLQESNLSLLPEGAIRSTANQALRFWGANRGTFDTIISTFCSEFEAYVRSSANAPIRSLEGRACIV